MPQPSEVDVLISGAGPAGLMLATWLSKLGITTRIVDKRLPSTKHIGQADGVQCRTVEVFQSFGFSERLVKEGAHINEVCFWNPSDKGGIERTKRTPDNEPGTSRFPHAVLGQPRIEAFMIDAMKEFNDLEVELGVEPTSINVDSSLVNDLSSHPITVTLRHLKDEGADPAVADTVANGLFRSNLLTDEEAKGREHEGEYEETVKAKYVVGCDGARSWVRKQLGLKLEGESVNTYWGVLDALVITDFPDIRLKCTIHSKDSGSILVVPRERDLVRLYVQLGHTEKGERVDRNAVTPASILAKAQAIMAPYKIETPSVEWYTCYEVAQRVVDRVTLDERVFIAGDAFHTHSPKAGQGMNVSMGDTYNLGWKLAHVLQGKADPSLLSTYQHERLQTAKELIDLDRKLSTMFSSTPSADGSNTNGVSLTEFKEFFVKLGRWASGTAVHYKPSIIVAEEGEALAPGLPLGMRFESHQVVCIADARPWHIGDRFESDGRWRIVIFAGDLRTPEANARLERVATYLDTADGPLRSYTPANSDIDSVIETLTIQSNPRTSIEPNAFPYVLWPAKGPHGCRDYSKLYADDDSWFSGHGHAYKNLGIDPEKGCIVLVRPDQTVSLVCPVEEPQKIGDFLSQFMIKV